LCEEGYGVWQTNLANAFRRHADIGECRDLMVRWMCTVNFKNRIPSNVLDERLGVVCVADMGFLK